MKPDEYAGWSNSHDSAKPSKAVERSSPGPSNHLEDCYIFTPPELSGEAAITVPWPGGPGPYTVPRYCGLDCSAESAGTGYVVVASSREQAATLMSCNVLVVPKPSTPSLPGDCNFYECLP